MAKPKRTTTSVPTQRTAPARIHSDRTWTPKKPHTPRREFAFMREYSLLLCAAEPSGPFGPFNGGVAQ